ncbi:cdc42-interacting protein 4 isoform X1 [Microcaecilia unicolor]|uniref:Cdc42-interacting protein 4 isoform X1 n=1 Tax=Microcaecilia unicolor TaxID=1415580 RepID=A0A6P7XJR4_9AMPH|nr:cdc42-interacting protein 4 isoform X1 [Microcaecilia unicolor]
MDWGSELWDQFDTIERHTQWGLELLDKYVKFVRDRTEIEQCYAKQLRNLVKKYLPKRNNRDDPEFKYSQYQAFQQLVKELGDFAGQREVVAETLMVTICVELVKYSQEVKQERKMHLQEGRRAQQQLETTLKQLESSKRKFERDCRESERAHLTAERLDQDISVTKADVEKAKQQSQLRSDMAEESKNDYASCLQKFNQDQSRFYYSQMPETFRKLQEMDERRTVKLKEGFSLFSSAEQQVVPIIGKCLEGMKVAADSVNEKHDSQMLIEMNKSGFERPGDVEFEDFSQPMNRTSSDSSLGTLKGALDLRGDSRLLGKSKAKRWPFMKKNKLPSPPLSFLNSYSSSAANGPPSPRFSRDPLSYCLNEVNKTLKPRISSFRTLKRGSIVTEDFSHLPPEQRRKKLQQKIEERKRDLQKEIDQRDALNKMKDVYQKSPQMGNPNSLEPKISETLGNIEKLQLEIQKYETWLSTVESRMNNRGDSIMRNSGHSELTSTLNDSVCSLEKDSPETPRSDDSQDPLNQPIYTEFAEDFEEEAGSPIGQCTALYSFEGSGEGTIAMSEGEVLSLMEEDKGDGWTRVRKSKGTEGYVPTSYVQIHLK